MNLDPNHPEPLPGGMHRAARARYWPGWDLGVRAPMHGETPLSAEESRVAFRNGLARAPAAVVRRLQEQDLC